MQVQQVPQTVVADQSWRGRLVTITSGDEIVVKRQFFFRPGFITLRLTMHACGDGCEECRPLVKFVQGRLNGQGSYVRVSHKQAAQFAGCLWVEIPCPLSADPVKDLQEILGVDVQAEAITGFYTH